MLKCVLVLGLAAFVHADTEAITVLVPASGYNISGTITFTETSQGILISGNVTGLTEGNHGFHVHSLGDISGGCATTGAHFNPTNATHGGPNSTERHVGDLGNILAGSDGVAVINFTDNVIALSGVNNIIGRAVVVHKDEDDLGLGGDEGSKTTGNAGDRIACGVIGTKSETNSASVASVGLATLMSTVFMVYSLHRN